MKIIVFELLVYGITNIVVFGSIFESWRNFWNKLNPSFFGKLMSCPLCLSTWVGGILSIAFSYFDYLKYRENSRDKPMKIPNLNWNFHKFYF